MAFRDQRTMTGSNVHSTPEEIRAEWERWAAQVGFERAEDTLKVYSLRSSSETLIANVSTARWVADCPLCNGGVALWIENPESCCLTCGTVYSAHDWPTAEEIAEAEAILGVRPEENQAWRRDHGETTTDLRAQNITHGYPIPSGAVA